MNNCATQTCKSTLNKFNPLHLSVKCVAVVTEDVREQLIEASTATKKAITAYRREADADEHLNVAEGQASTGEKNQDDNEMSVIITIMQPILRLMQLLCENHNRELQVSSLTREYFEIIVHNW